MENKEIEKVKTTEENTATLKPKVNSEVISVKKDILDKILAKQEEQDKELTILREVADKSRLFNLQQKNRGELGKTVRVSTYKGLIVLAWKMVVDEMYQDAKQVWHEKQLTEIKLEDGTTETLSILDFSRLLVKIEGNVLSSIKDEQTGTETLKIANEAGKEYLIDTTYVN